jgi:hypothetical protein
MVKSNAMNDRGTNALKTHMSDVDKMEMRQTRRGQSGLLLTHEQSFSSESIPLMTFGHILLSLSSQDGSKNAWDVRYAIVLDQLLRQIIFFHKRIKFHSPHLFPGVRRFFFARSFRPRRSSSTLLVEHRYSILSKIPVRCSMLCRGQRFYEENS